MRKIENETYTRQAQYLEMRYLMGLIPDPDPILRSKGKDISLYRELLYDSHVDSCITSRESGFLSREFLITSPSTRRIDRKALDFVRENFSNIDIENLMIAIHNAIYFGFSVIEKIYSTDGSYIYLEKAIERPQEWFAFDENNELVFRAKYNKTEKVDYSKIELVTHKASYLNPYGERKLAKVFWPVSFKKGGITFWMNFAEKFGSVFLYATVNHESKRDKMLQALSEMVQNAVGVIETGDEIHTLNVEKSGSSNLYSDLIEFCNAEISKSILGQTLTTQEGRSGSYAQAKVHFEVRKDIIEYDIKFIQRVMNRIIQKLVDLNFSDIETYPQFILYEEDVIDIDTVLKLQNCGVRFNKEFFIKKFHLLPEHFELASVQPETSYSEYKDNSKETDNYNDIIEEDHKIQNFIEKTLPDFQKAFEPFLKEAQQVIDNSENYDEAVQKLLALTGKERDYSELQELFLAVDLIVREGIEKSLSYSELARDVIDSLQNKVPLTPDDYKNLQDRYKNLAFTVASYQEEDKIAEILDELIQAKKEKLTYSEFRKRMKEKGLSVSPIVYYQNVRNAQMAARYNMLKDMTDDYPYWQYVAILDSHTRPSHAALHGKVWRADDPFWDTYYPPNGFNCRCNVRPVSAAYVNSKNIPIQKGSTDVPFVPQDGFQNNVGKDLNWIREKQHEAISENRDIPLVSEKIDFKKIITKDPHIDSSLLCEVPSIDEHTDLKKLIQDFCQKYNLPEKEIEITDYKGKVIKINYREAVRHIVEDRKNLTERKKRMQSLAYIRLIPMIAKDPDMVVANIYVRKNSKLKISKMYIKKINSHEFAIFVANYDRDNPEYRMATIFLTDKQRGWIIK
ncbi:MAG: DUF935 family protein [Brevinematales bacterium]|nr:DUF935 family protein [Brevinematales bacterium]